MYKQVISEIREIYKTDKPIPLHAPVFKGNEKKYVLDCIDSTFVSSVGEYVGKFEQSLSQFTKLPYAVATTNGTSALHLALVMAGVNSDSAVITQSLTFVATTNAIAYCHATPIFIDSAEDNLGMCPDELDQFLKQECSRNASGQTIHKATKKVIKACVPMHVFGHPCKIEALLKVCEQYNIQIIEDCAESLGSYYCGGLHTGMKSQISILSFNGNKVVTTGGGGMMMFLNESTAQIAKHLSTTAKVPHQWEFQHDQVGYNYRLPNLNAALGVAQMEHLQDFLKIKRKIALHYESFFKKIGLNFVSEPENCKSNYWLNAILLKDRTEREQFLKESNEAGVMTRPVWNLMHSLPAFKQAPKTKMINAQNFADRLVNIPSGVI